MEKYHFIQECSTVTWEDAEHNKTYTHYYECNGIDKVNETICSFRNMLVLGLSQPFRMYRPSFNVHVIDSAITVKQLGVQDKDGNKHDEYLLKLVLQLKKYQ